MQGDSAAAMPFGRPPGSGRGDAQIGGGGVAGGLQHVVEDGEGEGGGVIVIGSANLRPKTTGVSCGDCSSTQGSQGQEEQQPQGEAGGHCGGGDGKRANVGALKGMGGRGVVELREATSERVLKEVRT